MAKQKSNSTVDSASTVEAPAVIEPIAENNQPAVPEVKDTPESHISPNVEQLLKIYPLYPSLYIDPDGSVFTTDTPEQVRGKAKLYNNPFYN